MDDATIYERRGPVAWLTINRPQALNALNSEVRAGLFTGVRRFNKDKDARVLVVTGAGDRAFCAGADLKEMADNSLGVPPRDFLPQFGHNVTVEKPTIAAVNGIAYAGGFLLAQYCDLCIAVEDAKFAVTEAKVGRGAPWAAPLPWLVAPRIAMQILLTAEPIDASRARELGLVNEVVPRSELTDCVQKMGETIAANAPLSVMAAKRTIQLASEMPVNKAIKEAETLWEPVYRSADAQEGPAAFRDGRKPVWTGT